MQEKSMLDPSGSLWLTEVRSKLADFWHGRSLLEAKRDLNREEGGDEEDLAVPAAVAVGKAGEHRRDTLASPWIWILGGMAIKTHWALTYLRRKYEGPLFRWCHLVYLL